MSMITKVAPLIFTAVLAVVAATEWALRRYRPAAFAGAMRRANQNLDSIAQRVTGKPMRWDKGTSLAAQDMPPGVTQTMQETVQKAAKKGKYRFHYFAHQWTDDLPDILEGADKDAQQRFRDSMSYQLSQLEEWPRYTAAIIASLVAVTTTIAITLAHVPEDNPWAFVFTYVVPFVFITIPLLLHLMRIRNVQYWSRLDRAVGPEYTLKTLRDELRRLQRQAQGEDEASAIRTAATTANRALRDVRAAADDDLAALDRANQAISDIKEKVAVAPSAATASVIQAAEAQVKAVPQLQRQVAEARETHEAAKQAQGKIDQLVKTAEARVKQRVVENMKLSTTEAAAARIQSMFRVRAATKRATELAELRAQTDAAQQEVDVDAAAATAAAAEAAQEANSAGGVVHAHTAETAKDKLKALKASTAAAKALEVKLAAEALATPATVAVVGEREATAAADELVALNQQMRATVAHAHQAAAEAARVAKQAAKKADTFARWQAVSDEIADMRARLESLRPKIAQAASDGDRDEVKRLKQEKNSILRRGPTGKTTGRLREKEIELARLWGELQRYGGVNKLSD